MWIEREGTVRKAFLILGVFVITILLVSCVPNLQSGKPAAYLDLCRYEPFWEMIEEVQEVTIDSRKACQEYIKQLEE